MLSPFKILDSPWKNSICRTYKDKLLAQDPRKKDIWSTNEEFMSENEIATSYVHVP